MLNKRLLLSTCLLPIMLQAAPALAQTAAPAKSGGLDEIVVTAQRREERLQDVPVTVTAFGTKAIDQLRLNDAITTSKFVPGMISQHNAGLASANAYYLRGLGNSQSTPTFDAPVTTYADDIYIARQNANNYAFFDTERVEVLRGPQGTLFGRNTTGGAVNVIMRRPSANFGAKLEATAGSFSRFTIKGTVDAPVSDQVLTKVSAFYVTDDGYMKNITTGETMNGEKNYGLRADVRLLPTDGLTVDLSTEYTSNDSTYTGMRNVPGTSPYITGGTTVPVFYESAAGLAHTKCSDFNVDTLLTTGKGSCNLSQNFAISANIGYEVSNGTINYIFGLRHLDQGYINQYDASTTNKYAAYILTDNGEHRQVSHELKYNGEFAEGRARLVTGLFYLKEKSDDRQTTFSGGTTAFKVIQDQHLLPKTETAAIYAQADYDATEQLTVTLGARYTWEKKNVDYLASTQFTGFGYTGAQVKAYNIPLEQTFKKLTPRVAISYKVNPDVLLFATATNGFKSGGWNGGSAAPANAVIFNPEKTWSFESGMKSEFLDNRARVNVTGYFARTKDLQVTAGVVSPVTGAIASLPFNAGTLEVYGVEVESNFVITPELSLFANPSYMHGRYTYIVPTATVLNTNYLPVRVPSFQFSGGLTYERQVESLGGSVGATMAYRHNSPYWVAVLNTTKTRIENFLDASIRYKTADEKIEVSLEGTNLTKQTTVTANFLALFPGDPRRLTARVKFKF